MNDDKNYESLKTNKKHYRYLSLVNNDSQPKFERIMKDCSEIFDNKHFTNNSKQSLIGYYWLIQNNVTAGTNKIYLDNLRIMFLDLKNKKFKNIESQYVDVLKHEFNDYFLGVSTNENFINVSKEYGNFTDLEVILLEFRKRYFLLSGTITDLFQNFGLSHIINEIINELSDFLSFIDEPRILNEFVKYGYSFGEFHKWIIHSFVCVKQIKKDLLILTEGSTRLDPITFEELFYNHQDAEVCLNVLREIKPPVIDAMNNYIGKGKGIFPLWIQLLKTYKPNPLIKHYSDAIYKDLLNDKIIGLNLTKDASEFRKTYKRLINSNKDLDIKVILSQYSQQGKLGK